MPDIYDAATRSRVMRQVKGKNTMPELVLRKALYSRGIRGYRIHRKDIVGNPDIVFIGLKVAVFVDGDWWHGHPSKWWKGRSGDYWDTKIQRNIDRDKYVTSELESNGWIVVRLWESTVAKHTEEAIALVEAALSKAAQKKQRLSPPF